MTDVNRLIAEHLNIWTSAIEKKSGAGRGNGGAKNLYGIKKLRELILELAVRGKLVPQDESDEPASVLLERLRNRQAEMYEEGKIKKPRPLAKVADAEAPFELPPGWAWCRISQLGHDWGQKVPDTKFTYIDVGSINKELGLVSDPSVVSASEAPSRARKLVRQGTVIYSTVRPYLLNIAVVTNEFEPEPIASTAFAIVHPFEGVSASYLYRYFRSPTFISYVEGCQTGVAYPAINDKQFFAGLVPLPPSAEQHRIVAKVDELMGLCDTLEAQAEDGLKAHQSLVETCLAALTDSQTTEYLEKNWSRVESNFDEIFQTVDSVDYLKKTISQLAVMGRLNERETSAQNASNLLKLVSEKRLGMIAAKAIRKEKPTLPVDPDNVPFALPDGWQWARIGQIALFTQYGTSTKAPIADQGTPVLAMGNIQDGLVTLSAQKKLPIDSEEFPDLLLLKNDILYNRTNSAELVGKTGIFKGEDNSATFASYLIRIRVSDDLISPDYINLAMNTPLFRKTQVEPHIQQQTGQANVNGTIMRNMLVPVPPLEEQLQIIAKVEELHRICDQIGADLTHVNELKVALANQVVIDLAA